MTKRKNGEACELGVDLLVYESVAKYGAFTHETENLKSRYTMAHMFSACLSLQSYRSLSKSSCCLGACWLMII